MCDALAVFALRNLVVVLALTVPLATPTTGHAAPNTYPGAVESVDELPPEQITPSASSSQKVTYWSTGPNNQPMLSSAALFLPEGEPPPGGWPIIARAHGTTGIGDQCAPTVVGWGQLTREYVGHLLAEGFAVMATDYVGLGTPGVHPYLDGPSEADSVIDSVRAARAVEPRLSNVWAAVGLSQGGQAVMFTARIANKAAPELDYRGGVALAVPTRLERILPLLGPYAPAIPLEGTATFFAMILTGLRAAHPELDLNSYLTPRGIEVLDDLEETCATDADAKLKDTPLGALFTRQLNDPKLVAAFREMLEVPSSGFDRPLMFGQGLTDQVVPPPITADFVAELLANHVDVELRAYPGNHIDALFQSRVDTIAFLHKVLDKR